METLADLVARDRRSDASALLAGEREMDYRRFCTTVWKTSNFLRHLGVGGDRGVLALADASPPPLLTFLGAALLNVPTRFVDDVDRLLPEAAETEARAVLVPASEAIGVETPAGTTLAVHGDAPPDPAAEHWEGGVWSENPAFVPPSATPDSTALVSDDGTVTHGNLLAAGRHVADDLAMTAADTVGVRASLADPRAVAVVVASLLVGGSVRLGSGPATVTVGDGDADHSLGVASL